MARKNLSLGGVEAPQDVEVTLGDHKFKLVPVDRDVEDRLFAHGERIRRISSGESESGADLAYAMAAQLDDLLVRTTPLRDGETDDNTRASRLVTDAYDAGRTTSAEIAKLVGGIVEAGRPT